MSEEKYSVEGLRSTIQGISANIQVLKGAEAEQDKIVDQYQKLIRDIEAGVRKGKVYTVEGLTNGIEQAKKHKAYLHKTRMEERARIQQIQQHINDLQKAEELSEPKVYIEYESLEEAAAALHGPKVGPPE